MLSLFTGIETYNWKQSDYDQLITFCKDNGVGQVILKIYEITQGYWPSISYVKYIRDAGIDVLPYGYFYGNDIQTEASVVKQSLATYGKFCMDMEAEWNNQPNKISTLVSLLKGHSGDLYVSTWADPEFQGWVQNILLLQPIVKVFMPQAYSNDLVKDMYAQYPKLYPGIGIQPTFHIDNTSSVMATPYENFSLWEYQLALQANQTFKEYVAIEQGNNHVESNQEKQAADIWGMSILKLPTGSGIYKAWLSAYLNPNAVQQFNFGPPITPEASSIDWNGDKIQVQYFASGVRAEFNVNTGKTIFYGVTEILYEN